MFTLSLSLLSPPKLPRNVFFPWPNFLLHQSGVWLAPNRVCFRVPVHLTKLEIREYLRKIYDIKAIKVNTMIKLPKVQQNQHGQYYKMGAQYKKAYVTCEERIPDSVKILRSSRDLRKNPDLVPNFFVDSKIHPFRPQASRANDWKPRHKEAWKEPIPLLLSEDLPRLGPADDFSLRVDTRMPFQHFSGEKKIPDGTPGQVFPRVSARQIRQAKGRPKVTGSAVFSNMVRE